MWSFKPNLFIKNPNTKQKKLHSPTKNQHYLDARTNEEHSWWDQPSSDNIKWGKLICSAYAAVPARSAVQLLLQELLQSPSPDARAPRRKDLVPPLAMHAHPTELTPQSRVMGDFLHPPVLCSKLGLRQRRKSSNRNLHPNPKSADWGLLDPALCTVLYLKITDTQQTWLLSSTEGEKEQHKHWTVLAEAIKQFKCADTFPMHHHSAGPCF